MKPAADSASAAESAAARRSPRLRQRVAWMYYVEEMTQSAIADALGIGRITVVRLLAEARAMNEVRITLSREVAELSRLEIELQKRFDIPEVIVAPRSSPEADPRAIVAAAAAPYISDMLKPDMKIGVGWGRTLSRTLGYIQERPQPRLSIVSLLGGILRARAANPAELASEFARVFMAECYLIAAPAVVDSPGTKRTLIERCGLKEVFDFAKNLDAVVLGVGSLRNSTASFYGVVPERELDALRDIGAVGELLYNFFDVDGRLVDHPINERAMSIPLSSVRRAPIRLLVAGGEDKAEAMIGAFQLLRPTMFVTDEIAAQALLDHGEAARPAI